MSSQTSTPPPADTWLHDPHGEAPAIRVEGFLATGRSFDIAEGREAERGRKMVLKAIRYPADASEEARRIRRELSALEADTLRRNIPGLPEGGRLVFPEKGEDAAIREPIVAMEQVDGVLLPDWLQRHHPRGLTTGKALEILRPIVDTLSQLHEEKLVFRALAPEHVILPHEGRPILIGTGNIGQRGARVEPVRSYVHPRFSAPEILQERSGIFVTPRADVYSVGMMLAWLCTGLGPSGTPDEPVGREVWARLMDHPEGIRLLVAHCTQPFHKKRMARLSRLLPLLHPDHLPTRQTEGFGEVWLLAPWRDAAKGPHTMTPLSPGPLVGRSTNRHSPLTMGGTQPEGQATDRADADVQTTDLDDVPATVRANDPTTDRADADVQTTDRANDPTTELANADVQTTELANADVQTTELANADVQATDQAGEGAPEYGAVDGDRAVGPSASPSSAVGREATHAGAAQAAAPGPSPSEEGAASATRAESPAPGTAPAPWDESPRARALRIGFSVAIVVAALILGGMRLCGG